MNLDSADTESTDERISPPESTDERSKGHRSTYEDKFAMIYSYINKTHLFLVKLRLFLFAEVTYSHCREENDKYVSFVICGITET